MRSRIYLKPLSQRDEILRDNLCSVTHTGAVGRFRCTRVGSSSSSSGSESGFSYVGKSSASGSELSSISSIEIILEDGWVGVFCLAEELFLREFGGRSDEPVNWEDAVLRSSTEPRGSLTLVRLVYHCPSELLISSTLNSNLLPTGSTSSDKAAPNTIPKNLARCDEAARRFEIALR